MSTRAVVRMLAILALAAEVGVLMLVMAHVARGAAWARRLRRDVAGYALTAGALVAGIATAGSLYFSEVAGFVPCDLCWYQRIAMYPIALILLVAAIRRDPGARWAAMIIAGIGASVSVWHLFVERIPSLGEGVCSATAPCSTRWVEEFGYLTIPAMALSGFLLIIALLSTIRSES